MMRIGHIEKVIKQFDENLGVEISFKNDCYLYVSTDKHRYYISFFNIDEIKNKRDFMFYLDCIKAKEI